MNEENKPYFEIFNNFWSLLKPYAKDEKAYKKIMGDIFKMFVKDRGKEYTEEWWESTDDIVEYPERYKGTCYVEFAADLAISICDYWQYASTNKATSYDFMRFIGSAFIAEWERIRQKGT